MVTLSVSRRSREIQRRQARRRRLGHLSDAELFRTREVAQGGSLSLAAEFPDALAPVTFEGVFDFATGAAGTFFDTGLLSLSATTTGLRLAYGAFAPQDVTLGNGRRVRWNLAFRPGDAQVRLWIDSERVVAAELGTIAPLAWHANGTLTYLDAGGIDLVSPLSAYALQRPRHFGDAALVLPDPGVTDNDILMRAAIATFLATGSHPFVDNPDALP